MPRFAKGSQEAKDFMAKIRGSKGKPKDPNAPPKRLTKAQKKKAFLNLEQPTDAFVKIQQVGEDELIVPQFFAKKLAPSKKKAIRFRLVNPITQERRLATRNGESVVKISRRPTPETVVMGNDPTPIPLTAFSRADQEKVKQQFKAISVFGNREPNEMPKIPLDKPKPRGRPTRLPKNIEWWKENAKSVRQAKQEKTDLKTAMAKAKATAKAEKDAKKPKPPAPKEPDAEPNIKLIIDEDEDEPEDEDEDKPEEEPKTPDSPENTFFPAPMKPATTADIKDLKKRMDELVKTGADDGLDFFAPYPFFFNLIFAGILLKYGNKCFWDSNVAKGRNIWTGSSSGLKIIYSNENMNKVEDLTPIFKDDFIKSFGEHIQGCIKRGEEVIVLPLTLFGYTKEMLKNSNGDKYVNYKAVESGHANMIVFRPKKGLVERFEPHGSKSGLSEGITSQGEIVINKVLTKFWEKDMKKYLGKIRFVPPIDICPTKYPKSEGFQSIQSQIGTDIFGNKYRGFCGMWSVFFAEMVITNPEKTSDQLITEALDISQEDPNYMLQLIKGYTRLGEVMLGEVYDNIGFKNWKYKLEAVDSNDPTYAGLLHSTSIDMSKKIGEYLRQTFTDINTRTGDAISQPKKPDAPLVPSKYGDIEAQFKGGAEVDKIKRAFKSIKMKKSLFNELYDIFVGSEKIRQIYDNFFTQSNLTPNEIEDKKYFFFADAIVSKDQVENQPSRLNRVLTFIETNFAGNKRAGTVLKQANKQREALGKFLSGKGILDDIKNTFNQGVKVVKKGVNRGVEAVKSGFEDAKDFAKVVISGRNDYQPQGRAILKKYGGETIKAIEIGRDPVLPALKGVLNAISGGEFGKRVEKADYDDLFHLFATITLASGKKIMTEKNEVIIISESIPARTDKAEYRMIGNLPSITMETLFSNNRKRMGGKYFNYSAKDNNCQDYLLSMLKSSGIGTDEEYKFVKQDTKQLFEGMPGLRKFANSITGFAGKLDVLLSGRGLDQNKICGKCIKGMVHTCEMCGGRISSKDVEKFFRNAGKKIIGKKATKQVEKFGEDAGKYITAKKGGLATDLIDYGVPAATAAVLGGLSGLATGGLGGVVGSAAGSKLGKEVIAPALHKATGAGVGGRSAWITLVKKVARDKGISYKEAMSVASAMRKK